MVEVAKKDRYRSVKLLVVGEPEFKKLQTIQQNPPAWAFRSRALLYAAMNVIHIVIVARIVSEPFQDSEIKNSIFQLRCAKL